MSGSGGTMPRALVAEAGGVLEALLLEAVAEADGAAAAELLSRASRGAFRDFAALGPAEAVFLARALTCRSLLAAVAEDAATRRRHDEAEAAETDDPLASLAGALERLRGDAAIEPGRALGGLDVTPVFTAHPTEVRRRAVVEREFEIQRLLMRLRDGATPDPRQREDLFREIALLWRMRLHRPERITGPDENPNALAIFRDSVLS